MSFDILSVAFAIRAESAQSPHPIKLSHAQQCVAAAFGYRTLAAYQASHEETHSLHGAAHVVLDMHTLLERSQDLGVPLDEPKWVALMRTAFRLKLPQATVHTSVPELEEALRYMVQHAVLNNESTAGAMAVTNNEGVGEIYLPFDLDWEAIPLHGELLALSIEGHVSMEIDVERPYSGHRIDIKATLTLGRIGRALLGTAVCHVEDAQLDYSWGGDDEQVAERSKVSLAEALARYLGLSLDESDALEDAEVHAVEGHDGSVLAHQFDFTSTASSEVAEKIEMEHGSLRVRVPSNFFDQVHGYAEHAERYYVHGDLSEDDPAKYCCRQCDTFEDAEHFEAQHPGQAEERYFSSLQLWQKRPARTKLNWRRPSNAVNVLAEVAQAQRSARDASRSPFHRWVAQQIERNDPVGDLARDIKRDRRFPISEASYDQLRSYLERASRSTAPVKAFKQAWAEFTSGNVAGA
jgi:uncharacterized protein YozE (UPF0346 family)